MRALQRLWRRSLQLRVVAATVVLGLLTVTTAGVVLAEEIGDRLFDSRRAQVLQEAARDAADAQDRLDVADVDTAAEVRERALLLISQLEGVGPERDRVVLLLRPPDNDDPAAIGDVFRGGLVPPSAVPEDLRAAVRASAGQQYRPVDIPDGAGGTAPALAVGQMIDVPIAGPYELYFVVDLSREQATLEAVQRVLLAGAAVLVLLVGAVAAVVARQVVQPVRQAADVAERLASGDLDERMAQRGEDELARLSRSFNAMADSLQQQIRDLEQLGTLQQRFVSDVSHELRTPLTTIRMAGEVIHEARGSFDPAVARSAELLATQLDRFEALLADLLEISRFDAGAAALHLEVVDVRAVVERAAELAAPLAERRGSRLQVRGPLEPCTAEVDRRRVERILRNLVVNAVEHGEGRPVHVETAVSADAVAVRVRDHGVGLSPADAARVFDRFWRADPARARSTGGTGLGLAISLEDAHLHGGQLLACGVPDGGASFLLVLPRRAGEPAGASPLGLRERAAIERA
ncbi:two-component system, OmpR family, sensor histidine kinase MtrB [Quadrisphaera sp. DSM 44207]|nr:two-component system, OmpR family, sensor histidine kinase MtrB [Quadrisphaera sp. DSM 44207]